MKKFNNYKPVRLIELFAGIGAQAKALENLGVTFEHWRVCEFDEHAVRSYNAVHNTHFAPSDITKISAKDLNIVNTSEFTYVLTYSFPCQDLSNAGAGKGMAKGSGTRSGLLWEVERLLNECAELPQVLLMENVPQVHSKKNMNDFNKWIAFLESKGYSNYWKDLNAKDYGIPQSRNRCYMVSILGEYSYEFPQPIPLELKLSNMLENEVDEKYYLSDKAIEGRQKSEFRQYNLDKSLLNGKDIHPTILARFEGSPTLIKETSELKRKLCNELIDRGLVGEGDVIRHSYTNNRLNNGVQNMGRTESKEKLSPTLDTRCDCLGVVVKESIALKEEVCNMAIENGLVTPYDMIDVSFSNARLDEMAQGAIKTMNSTDNQIANTITTSANNFGVCVPISDNKQPFISTDDESVIVRETTKQGYAIAYEGDSINLEQPNSNTRRGRVGKSVAQTLTTSPQQAVVEPRVIGGVGDKKSNGGTQWYQQDRIYDDKLAICVTTSANPYYTVEKQPLRIRKLTPKECWRLMGFDDEDFDKAERVCSNSKLYKQAGNSIVVDVLMAIFKELLIPQKTRSAWLDELLGGL